MKRLLDILLISLITLCLMEISLRVYNPLPLRVKGDQIILPAHQVYRFDMKDGTHPERHVVHTKNSLGFRGEEPPPNLEDYLSIITVGGSTTECFCLSDDKTWPYVLGEKLKSHLGRVWLNNAGLDGHSTFGHEILLRDHLVRLKPKVILFLVGINDEWANALRPLETKLMRHAGPWLEAVSKDSELAGLFTYFRRLYMARTGGLAHDEIDFVKQPQLVESAETRAETLALHQSKYIPSYRERLTRLIRLCRENGILPVFITQSTLAGAGTDPTTHVNLENILVWDQQDGRLYSDTLDLYNSALKQVARENGVCAIDLAAEMPKDSRYYYDFIHYTDAGASLVAEIVDRHLEPCLAKAGLTAHAGT